VIMMNPFDVAFEFIKAPLASYNEGYGSRYIDDESYNKIHMLNAQAGILAQDPAVAVDSSFGQYGVGVHGGIHRTQEKENVNTGRTEYSNLNYGVPYNRVVTNGKMQTDTLDKLRALGSTADREHGFTVHVKRLSNVYHDGKDWKHDNTGDRGHYQYSISPTESRLNEISNSPLYTRTVEQQKLFHNDVSKRTEEEKMHRNWWNDKKSHEGTLLNGSKNPYIFTDKQRENEDFDIHDTENHPKSRQDAERIDNNEFNFDLPLGSTVQETARMIGKKGKAGFKYGPYMPQSDYEDMLDALANPTPENLKLVDEILNDAKAEMKRQMIEKEKRTQAVSERQSAVPDNNKDKTPINQSAKFIADKKRKEKKEAAAQAEREERQKNYRLRRILNRGNKRKKGGSKANRQYGLKSEPMDIALQLLKAKRKTHPGDNISGFAERNLPDNFAIAPKFYDDKNSRIDWNEPIDTPTSPSFPSEFSPEEVADPAFKPIIEEMQRRISSDVDYLKDGEENEENSSELNDVDLDTIHPMNQYPSIRSRSGRYFTNLPVFGVADGNRDRGAMDDEFSFQNVPFNEDTYFTRGEAMDIAFQLLKDSNDKIQEMSNNKLRFFAAPGYLSNAKDKAKKIKELGLTTQQVDAAKREMELRQMETEGNMPQVFNSPKSHLDDGTLNPEYETMRDVVDFYDPQLLDGNVSSRDPDDDGPPLRVPQSQPPEDDNFDENEFDYEDRLDDVRFEMPGKFYGQPEPRETYEHLKETAPPEDAEKYLNRYRKFVMNSHINPEWHKEKMREYFDATLRDAVPPYNPTPSEGESATPKHTKDFPEGEDILDEKPFWSSTKLGQPDATGFQHEWQNNNKSEPMDIAFQLLKTPVMPGRDGFPEDDPYYLSPNDQMWNDEADKDLEEKTNALWKYAEANGINPGLMLDAWHDRASFVEGLDYDGDKPDTGELKFRAHAVDPSEWKKLASEPMDIVFQLLKERKSPQAFANKKKYDSEYQKDPKRVKYREQLNAERRKRGIYGKGGKDVSHTQGGKLTLESVHANRARHFKNKGTLRRVK